MSRRAGGGGAADAPTIGRLAALATALLLAAPGPTAAGSASIAAHVRASPLGVALELSASIVTTGQSIKATAKVTNNGVTTVKSIQVELRGDPVGLAFRAGNVSIGQLKPGKSALATWSVCGRSAGAYVLLARVTFEGVSIDSPARMFLVQGGGRKTCP